MGGLDDDQRPLDRLACLVQDADHQVVHLRKLNRRQGLRPGEQNRSDV